MLNRDYYCYCYYYSTFLSDNWKMVEDSGSLCKYNVTPANVKMNIINCAILYEKVYCNIASEPTAVDLR